MLWAVALSRLKEEQNELASGCDSFGISGANMNRQLTVLLTLMSVTLLGQENLQSRDELNQGVASYKTAHYAEAVTHFQRALELDPSNLNAQLYLATAYFAQWVPGADDQPGNASNRALASQYFRAVLEKDPKNPVALAMMASMAYNAAHASSGEQKEANLDEAVRWNLRRIEAEPEEAEAYYYLGVIDWVKVYTPIQTARQQLGMNPPDPGPIKDANLRSALQSQFGQTIQDGLANLHKCLTIDRGNEDAMTYLSLLFRKKADLEDSVEAATSDLKQADEWADKSIAAKQKKPDSKPSSAGEVRTLRIGGKEAQKNLIHRVDPVYPVIAKAGDVKRRGRV